MAEIRSTSAATSETSFYSALENLFNEVGRTLDPAVVCNGQLKDQGAGHPDFGLYGQKQCHKGEPKPGQGEIPERGVIEVKPLADKTWQTAKGKQATKYFDRYRLVLVTNYRDFRLVGEDESGRPVQREYYSLADDEKEFWTLAAHSIKTSKQSAAKFFEFLRRVLMNAAPLTTAEDVAWFLASYARDALVILEEKDATALAPLRSALEAALGIKFEGPKGEHFFRSTLIQTLFYGIFSAWVIWARTGGAGKFDWRHSGFILTVPMIRTLFEEIAKPSRLAPLGLMSTLDRTGEALDRIDRVALFKHFDTAQAVQHFYEPFLEHFDPQLRKELGVWYTPPEIVHYMVERIDAVLRSELGLSNGFADKSVFILDPCCGTGTFVVEVLRRIEKTLRENGVDALLADDIKDAARQRVFGFEMLSAPFVIAHWQVSNFLASLGAPLDPAKDERASIFLTNALTGWEPPAGPKAALPQFPELERERDAAQHVKRDVPILVVLGNPPYNAYAGTSPDEEQGLVEPYKKGLVETWGIKKFNLDEFYVRFMRLAERRVAEQTGKGVVCYISSFSYLSDVSFVVMRQRLLREFDRIWIDSLNGDSRETGKRTPDGKPDPSVFSTKMNPAGIRLGTSIGLFVRKVKRDSGPIVQYRDFWGTKKKQDLIESLSTPSLEDSYKLANPQPHNRFSFRPGSVRANYLSWPKISDLCVAPPLNGLMEKRGGALIDIDRAALAERMKTYFDTKLDWSAYKLIGGPLSKNAARFDAQKCRANLISKESFGDEKTVRYVVRPFDVRFCYYSAIRPLWNEPRPNLWAQKSHFLVTRPARVAEPEGVPFYFTKCLGDNDAMRGHAYYFPFVYTEASKGLLPGNSRSNLSERVRNYLVSLDIKPDEQAAEQIWLHVLAVGFSPRYLSENADGVRIDWPRIPLPHNRDQLGSSAALGKRLSALLDTEAGVLGVNEGTVNEHLRVMGPISAADLTVSAEWGRLDNTGKVYPGKGRIKKREWTETERKALCTGFVSAGVEQAQALQVLGKPIDVYLNDTTYWGAVPESVWEYYIGGYQVIKKWLSYRDVAVLGRPLTKSEVRDVTSMVRRLASVVLMSGELDVNYERVSASA